MSCAVILSSVSKHRQPLKNDKNASDNCNSPARSGGIKTDMGSLLEDRGTDRKDSPNGAGDEAAPPNAPPTPLKRLLPSTGVKGVKKPRPLLALPAEVAIPGPPPVPAPAPAAVEAEVDASEYSPLLRLPPLALLTPLWKELICGQTSLTRFQYRLFLGICKRKGGAPAGGGGGENHEEAYTVQDTHIYTEHQESQAETFSYSALPCKTL